MADDLDQMGPIDDLVLEFPGNRMTGEAFPLLVDLVDRGLVRILDLVLVRKDIDGSVLALELNDVDGDGELDLSVLAGGSRTDRITNRQDHEQRRGWAMPGLMRADLGALKEQGVLSDAKFEAQKNKVLSS